MLELKYAKSTIVIFIISLLFPVHSFALSPEASEGKALYPACHVCHDQSLDPPQGPPMWSVQRRYNNNFLDKEDFIKSMVSFVKTPSLEKAIHDPAVEMMGLMAPLPLPDDMLTKIATYIYEEKFPPPCKHWEIGIKRAKERGDLEHAEKDQYQLNRFL